jgi:hypothetical protein
MQKVACVMMCWIFASSIGYAQSDWGAVTATPPGTRLRIEAQKGRQVEGVLEAVDDTQLTLQRKPPAARADIRKVERLGAPRTAKLAKWGFLVGAVSGAALSYAVVETNKGPWAARMSVGWGAIGAAIGAISGARSPKRSLIYMNP